MNNSSPYHHRIQRALDYILSNIDKPLPLDDVSKAACLSAFHFHRIFSAVMGETLGQFITRKRMESGALMLAYHRHKSVTEIAFSCGYSSVANFSKAFSAFFGCSPSKVRHPAPGQLQDSKIGKLKSKYGKDFSANALYSLPAPRDESELANSLARLEKITEVKTVSGFPMVCSRSEAGYTLSANKTLWASFIKKLMLLGFCGEEVDAYGLCYDSPLLTPRDRCRYDACVRIDKEVQVAEPLFVSHFPSGRYAVLSFEGAVQDSWRLYRDVYSVWLPHYGLEPDDFPPVEHYIHGEPDEQGFVQMEIMIKVRALSM